MPSHGKISRDPSSQKRLPSTINILQPELRIARPKLLIAPEHRDGLAFASDDKGYANFELEIGSDGTVLNARTIDSNLPDDFLKIIESSTFDAIFKPAVEGGKKVKGKANLRFEFHPAEPVDLRYEWIPDFEPNSG
ncbi:energy transducer TonB [Dechloromonas sp. XY25]|uniref:Energy transducer TonB n=1 Tax=Dechloromonas hankyongensis TaxID=2908002 RepID=A0ABS9K568_9RHOO|nr:hypothetical protein [Dechloromonas hankyongensis]MCG2578317.1 energy transducer TonB [Dechloromonas hankyongensis]